MFTKVSKVILWIFVIGGVITSIAVGSNEGMGWFIPVGILATLVILSGIGMLIEMAENIEASREFLYEIASKTGGFYGANNSGRVYSTPRTQNTEDANYNNAPQPQATVNKDYGSALSRLNAVANGGAAPVNDFWYCTKCGEKNERLASICKGCGKYK